MSFKEAHSQVSVLVEQFRANEARYLARQYSEQDARNDFINKFFIALGWDVRHEIQTNPYEQEVKVEPPVKVSGAQKRADFSFSIAPNFRDPKFFVEAKKPQKDLFNKDYYFQTIRYGWHKNTPIAVLTDFEEFHILDCRFSPNPTTILDRKIKRFHYSEYSDEGKFAEIYWLFSREAILNNSLDKFAEGLPKPKGKAYQKALFAYEKHLTIDDAFLEEIDGIRVTLAKAFKKNDDTLNSEELTEATQRTIDRLVFIRFLEDKLIEPEHYVNTFGEGKSAWGDFIALCARLDAKYNGIVFKKSFIDRSSFKGPIDTEFHQICQNICHLNSRFLFNEIPIHILGSIYERFLGKVVHATTKRVTVEAKPEVRKAGGVFYTPKYIVDYIVQNTVGKLIENKTPDQIAKMRFADIACGSGSFLIGVLDCLLDYHNKFFQAHSDKAKKSGCIYKDGLWVLSIKQKQDILRNNIFGVDIDSQAVEVTQLSLSLKMLEDETTATANEMQVLFHEKILPDMSKNIICGNSLVSTDILTQSLFVSEEERKLNPLNLEDAFKIVMQDGGFNAIIGNPPYVKEDIANEIFKPVRKSKLAKYYQGKMDLWYFFVCYGLDLLVTSGLIGIIAPNNWITSFGASKLRNKVLSESIIRTFFDFNDFKVFKDAGIQTMITILQKSNNMAPFQTDYYKVKNKKIPVSTIRDVMNQAITTEEILHYQSKIFPQTIFNDTIAFTSKGVSIILEKLSQKSNYHLPDESIGNGIDVLQDLVAESHLQKLNDKSIRKGEGVFVISLDELEKMKLEEKEKEYIKPYYTTNQLQRYYWDSSNSSYIIYADEYFRNHIKEYPNLKSHLDKYRSIMTSAFKPYGLHRAREQRFFEGEKILSTRKTIRGSFSLTTGACYVSRAFLIIQPKDIGLKYLLGLLNSTLMHFCLYEAGKKQGEQLQVDKEPLLKLPLYITSDKAELDKINSLVEQLMDATRKKHTVKTDKDKDYYYRRCSELDAQIDTLVYQLYGLSKEEITIIEKSIQ